MNQEAIDQPDLNDGAEKSSAFLSTLPIFLAVVGPILLAAARIEFGAEVFISDEAAMLLALASYLIAAVFYLTSLYASFTLAATLGIWAATVGVFWNLSSWLLRWVSAYDRELSIFRDQGDGVEDMSSVFRYVPFANLYDLSLAFAFGAGVTTLLLMRRSQYRIIAAVSLPLTAIILVLARFIGNDLIDLPPVLDSYWRPIHVGIASLSYGVALVCFAAAVLYLLKDGLKVEKMAIWTSAFAIAVFASISNFSVFAPASLGTYTASTLVGSSRISLALRADIPYVGWLLVIAAVLLLATIILFVIHTAKESAAARVFGRVVLATAMVMQAAVIGVLAYQIRTIENLLPLINPSQQERFAIWMLQQDDVAQATINRMSSPELIGIATKWINENGSQLHLSLNANPVEFAALITAFAGTLFVFLIGVNTDKLLRALPSAEALDSLMYKLAGVAFAGLALLLITGAVWANESWGRYWGWDAKETGALVTWLTYAGFLHSRIAYGWRGRRSAYFAITAFLFVIFTYLGVSYLLPGLHSYA